MPTKRSMTRGKATKTHGTKPHVLGWRPVTATGHTTGHTTRHTTRHTTHVHKTGATATKRERNASKHSSLPSLNECFGVVVVYRKFRFICCNLHKYDHI
jgi:hypothetical protein